MAYGVVYGQTGVVKVPLSRTILPIASIVAGSGVVAGATPNTFVVGELGMHQVDFDFNVSSPTNNTPFTLQLWNVTLDTLVQSRTAVAPQQSNASDMYFGFEWMNASLTDEYAFYIVPNISVALNGFCLLLQEINFRAVVQEFGGAGVGPGTVGRIAKFTAIGAIGDSIMSEAATTITLAGAMSLAGANNTTFLEFTDGQNVPVSAANQGRIRYNTALQTFQFSENGGAWADLSGVGPGTVNRIAKFATANTVGDSSITDTGIAVAIAQTISAGGNPSALTLTGAAHTALTGGAETIDVNLNLARNVQHDTGAIATQRAMLIQAPTYSFVGVSAITTAATLAISGPPVAGANATITTALALWVQSGDATIAGVANAATFRTTGLEANINTSQTVCATFQYKWTSGAAYTDSVDTILARRGTQLIGVGNGLTSDVMRLDACGRVYGNAVANPTPSATTTDHTTDGATCVITTTTAHNLCVGQSVTLAGWTWAAGGGVVDGTWFVATVPDATHFSIAPTTPPTAGSNPTVVGTITTVAQLQLGPAPLTASPGAIIAAGTGSLSTCIGPYGIASGVQSVSYGGGVASGDYTVSAGFNSTATASQSTALGAFAAARVSTTVNMSGADCARKDAGETPYWTYFSTRVNVIYGPEVDFLGAPADWTFTIPAGCHAWVEEVGWHCTVLNLDGGALTVQPTVRAGIVGTLAKYQAAVPTTLLTAAMKRERYTTLLADDGESSANSLTMGMTVAGTIAGGGAGVSYKGRPYMVIRVVEDE